MGKNSVVAGLEMGRTKLRMVVGEVKNGEFSILGASEAACLDSIKNGAIIKLDSITEAIIKLFEDIKQKIGKKINSIFVNITGLNIKQEVVNSVITLPQRGYEITRKNIDNLIESCKIVSIPLDRHLLYLLPLEYIIDGQDDIKDPIGLCGNRLEVKVLIITAPFNQVQNIIKVINSAGLDVGEVVLNALANAASILSIEEKKEGILLIDFKTDLTELSIFKDGSLVFFETISKGQGAITNEIATRLNMPLEFAEELKIRYGFLDNAQQDIRNQETIPLEWMGMRQNILRYDVNKIICEQVELIFDLILERLKGIKNFNNIIKRGAVLTGGATYMEGFLEGALQRFGFMIKIGNGHATSVGLAKLALEKKLKSNKLKGELSFFRKMYQKADELLTEYF